MAAFSRAPDTYVRRFGVTDPRELLLDQNIQVLKIVGEPQVRGALEAGDYDSFFRSLRNSGALNELDSSVLVQKLARVFADRREELSMLLARIPSHVSPDAVLMDLVSTRGAAGSDDSLVAVAEIVDRLYGNGSSPSPAIGVVPIAAIAIVVIVIAVGISFTVATGAAIVTSAVVMTEVTVRGTPRRPQFYQLDPAAVDNYQRMLRISQVVGDPHLVAQTTRELIEFESSAVVDALVLSGIVEEQTSRSEILKEAVTRYALKAAGIGDVHRFPSECSL